MPALLLHIVLAALTVGPSAPLPCAEAPLPRAKAPGPRVAAGGPEDVRGALRGLAAPSAAERLEAQRWLAAHLSTDDLAAVAETAGDAGVELSLRLVAALGADDRHLALAALLATDHDAGPRRVGKDALTRMALRWFEDDVGPAAEPNELAAAPQSVVEAGLSGRFGGRPLAFRPAALPLDHELDAIARRLDAPLALSGGSIGVALNPVLFAQSAGGREPGGPGVLRQQDASPVIGDPDQLLFDLLRERQLTVEAFALDGPRAWLHVVDPSGAGMRTADDLLGRWVREVLESPGRPRGAGAARALAGSGWPAALEWLEQRWLEFDDPNALEGLLLAAGRGRVTPGLAREEVVARWLAAADAALAAGDADGRLRAGEFLRALAGLGPRGSDGSDLAARVAADWDRANGAQRNLRLGVLAGMGRAPAELVAKVRAWIAAGAGGPTDAQRYGAVRMLAAVDLARSEPRPRLELTGALRLYELAEREGSLNAFDGWLRCIGAVPPAAWARPDEPRGGSEAMAPSLAARALLWYLDVEGPGPTAQRYLRYLATADLREHEAEVGEVLHVRTLAGGGDELRALFARTAEQGDATAKVDRLALLAGILDDARQAALAESLLAAGGRNPWDVVLVGALLAGPSGELVRPAFDAAVHDDLSRPTVLGPDAPWVRAAERAIDDLRRAGRVGEEKTLQRDLRQLLRGSAHPLLPGLQDDSWPPPPGLEVVPLESLDWRLAP